MKKILCILLVLLFTTAVFTACVEQPNTDTDTAAPASTGAVTVDGTTELDRVGYAQSFLDELPTTNLNEDFNILCMSGVGSSEIEVWAEEASEDPVIDSVYKRNGAVFDKLGVTITKMAVGDVTGTAQNDQKSASHEYNLIMGNGPTTSSLAQNGYLYNYLEQQEIFNLNEAWWDPGTLTDTAIGGKVYFMNGDINILDNDVTWILMFNKKMVEDNDLEEPYQLVRDGEWTLDKFYEMLKTVSKDEGDGKFDEKDTYGFLTTDGGGITNFYYTCDLLTVKLDDAGTPQIVMGDNQEKIYSILEWCNKTFHQDNLTWFSKNNPGQTSEMFQNNQGLFYSEVMSYIVNLRDMETPFGVLPTPKYNKEQPEYHTHVDNVGSLISIPSDVVDPVKTAQIVETLAIYSYIYVTPAYYDVTLKRKQSRDYESVEMLDIILQSRVYDIGYIYESIGLADIFRTLVADGKTEFASNFKTKSKAAQKAIDRIMKSYQE